MQFRSSLAGGRGVRLVLACSAMRLAERVSELEWYHTLELEPGLVTKGVFDLRLHVSRYGLPERMDGMRVLEVGTFDGFWAFEIP